MSDIRLQWRPDVGAADINVKANDLEPDDGMETAVALSLFTDRRDGGGRGWWADALTPDDPMGSRLWTLANEKDTATVLQLAPAYAREALAWMVTDGVASEVTASASSLPREPGRSIMLLTVGIQRPGQTAATYRYAYNWQSQEHRRYTNAV